MAHAGTPTDLAKQPATSTINGLWQALLVAVALVALVAGTIIVGTSLAAKGAVNPAVIPAADHSYDQIEAHRGAILLAPAANSYNQVEQSRNGTSLVPGVHYPDVSYDQNKPAPSRVSGTAPYNHPGLVKGHRGAMIDQ